MQREAIIGLAIVITLAVLAPNQSQVEWSDDNGADANAPSTLAHAESAEQSADANPAARSAPRIASY